MAISDWWHSARTAVSRGWEATKDAATGAVQAARSAVSGILGGGKSTNKNVRESKEGAASAVPPTATGHADLPAPRAGTDAPTATVITKKARHDPWWMRLLGISDAKNEVLDEIGGISSVTQSTLGQVADTLSDVKVLLGLFLALVGVSLSAHFLESKLLTALATVMALLVALPFFKIARDAFAASKQKVKTG